MMRAGGGFSLLALVACGSAQTGGGPGPSSSIGLEDLLEAPWGAGADELLERYGGIRSGNEITTVATVEGRDAKLVFRLRGGRLATVLVTWNDRLPSMEACQSEFAGLKERLDARLGPSSTDNLEASWASPDLRAELACDPTESGEAALHIELSGKRATRGGPSR